MFGVVKIVFDGDATFTFKTADGSAPSISSVTVIDEATAQELWTIVATDHVEFWSASNSQEISGRREMSYENEVDHSSLRRMIASAGVALMDIRYGYVPNGWSQVIPIAGSPPAFERGKSYRVEALGADAGVLIFSTSAM